MTLTYALILARWAHFAAAALLFGASLFLFYAIPCSEKRLFADTLPMLRIAAPLATASGLVWLAFSIVGLSGDAQSLFDPDFLGAFFLRTGFGEAWLVRLVLLAGLLVLAPFIGPGRTSVGVAVALSGALLASQAWLGHAMTVEGLMSPLALASYAVHILAASAWVGGLIALAFALQRLMGEGRGAMASIGNFVLRRFSVMGMIAVGVILLSGSLNTAFRISSLGDLLHSDWGAILLVKVTLFWIMVALASVNRFRLMPRIAGKSGGGNALLWNCMLEFLLGLMALAAAAALGVQPPPA